MDIRACVQRGNIVTHQIRPDLPGRYQANGRFGAVMDGWGFNADPARQVREPFSGRSQFTHMGHWGRFRFLSEAMGRETCADYILPLFRLHMENPPARLSAYKQEQDFWSGTLRTSYENASCGVEVLSWFDMADHDLAAFRVKITGSELSLLLTVADDFIPYPFLYKKRTAQQFSLEKDGRQWRLSISCQDTQNGVCSHLWLRTDCRAERQPKGLRLRLSPGVHEILISYGKPVDTVLSDSLSRTQKAWRDLWERSGLIRFSDPRAQQLYIRSLAYLLSSYCDDAGAIQPTSGLTGNMFPFHFVQDMEYIAPALMMTGHGDIVRRWVERFAAQIAPMRRYARRLWPNSRGICPPWELPFGDMDDYHTPSVPVIYCYEPHNVGYLCRMAREAAEDYGSEAWTEKFARPLVAECAAFYRAAAQKGEDCLWHLRWLPSLGQDEAGGRNGTDYLCSLYSAQYCFESAVAFGIEGDYADILREGLAFQRLVAEDGTLHTAQGADDRGKQKHPVQLDGLAFMPVAHAPAEHERIAWRMRHALTHRAGEPFFYGWTLGQFLLSDANLGDTEGWLRDWALLEKSDYVDPDWVQIYESSGQAEKSFYTTTHGMILQAMIRTLVNDYWGDVRIASCRAFGDCEFERLHVRPGVMVSGLLSGGLHRCTVTALRDGPVTVDGHRLTLRKNETYGLI